VGNAASISAAHGATTPSTAMQLSRSMPKRLPPWENTKPTPANTRVASAACASLSDDHVAGSVDDAARSVDAEIGSLTETLLSPLLRWTHFHTIHCFSVERPLGTQNSFAALVVARTLGGRNRLP